ncbi:MAG TPA: SET domain-containing protein-lysine N-methyltransferase [Candidatus Nitrosotalea sp.]|nr:SET domain-containing protein-lysine N-methyltransferase [Candidatus Nitrosotalea sp.]
MRQGVQRRPKVDPRFAWRRLRVSRSRIDGFGLFADEEIPRWQKVIEYTGERITNPEALRRFRILLDSGRTNRFYFFDLNKRWVLDGSRMGSGAELINHCCEPNLSTRIVRGHILYFSRRRIQRGEELTVDYHFSRRTVRIPCKCGAAKCRGTINVKSKARTQSTKRTPLVDRR